MNAKRSDRHSQTVQQKNACPMCATDGVTMEWSPLVFHYGSGKSMVELSVHVPVYRCDACGIEYLDEESEHIKHDAICQHLGVLPPTEIRRIRDQFGMTRAEFSRLTGIGETSFNRWENGLSIQTHAYDRYLRLLSSSISNSQSFPGC